MHGDVFFNSQIFSASDALINGVSSAALYGKGIFTTIAIRNREPFLWEKHWSRLTVNARKLEIELSDFSEEIVRSALHEIVEKNSIENGRARITFFDESSRAMWSFGDEQKTSLLISTADFRPMHDNFRLMVSPYCVNSTSPLAGIKSCNYLEKILALEDAKKRGFDEAVCLNERREIASAVMANIFWLRDSKLHTPSLRTGCLPGTTREFILENLECFEVESTFHDLRSSDSIFLTSSGIGVVRAAEFDGKNLEARPHAILDLVPRVN